MTPDKDLNAPCLPGPTRDGPTVRTCLEITGPVKEYYDIDLKEFLKTLRQKLNYTGPADVVRAAFAAIGGADDGKISVSELFEWSTGRRNAMITEPLSPTKLMSMRLEVPFREHESNPGTADSEEWTVDELRSSLQYMLIKARVPPHVLQTAWDHDGDGMLSSNEFLARFKRLVVAEDGEGSDLWYRCVRPTVRACFNDLAGKRACAAFHETHAAPRESFASVRTGSTVNSSMLPLLLVCRPRDRSNELFEVRQLQMA